MNAFCWLHRKQIIIVSAVILLIAAITWIGLQTILFRSASNSVCWITVDETGDRGTTYLNRLFYESGKLQRQELPLENAALVQGKVDEKILIVDDPPRGRFEPEYMDIYPPDEMGSELRQAAVFPHNSSQMRRKRIDPDVPAVIVLSLMRKVNVMHKQELLQPPIRGFKILHAASSLQICKSQS